MNLIILLYYCDVNITVNLENPLCFSTSIISSKFSKYKSVCETTKQFNLLSFAKFFKNSNTAPEFELSNVEITSSNVNVLIDGYRLLSNLNKLQLFRIKYSDYIINNILIIYIIQIKE